jgi:acetyltransferase
VGRYDHVAIHPYPSQHETKLQLGDGTDITIRPIRPEDAEIEQDFIRSLSPEAKYFRFMRSINELTPEMLVRFTQIDYDREMAFIATTRDPESGKEKQIGVGRYVTNPDGKTCEFALVVSDTHRRLSLGNRIMMALLESAKRRGLSTMIGEVLSNNEAMIHLMRRLGFAVRTSHDDPGIQTCTKEL